VGDGGNGEMHRAWRITRAELRDFLSDFQEDGTIQKPLPFDWLTWPAKGNPWWKQALDFSNLRTPLADLPAPFTDHNGDGRYNPYDGDYPDLKGDQMVWWISNDDNTADSLNRRPLKLDIAVTAYTYDCQEEHGLSAAVFIDYLLVNRAAITYDSCYFGLWSDPDLGCAYDDYFGTLPESDSVYVYNKDDSDCDPAGFGKDIPVQSITFLNPPLTNVAYHFNNAVAPPGTFAMCRPLQQYNLLKGLWPGGFPYTAAGGGHEGLGQPAQFVFPGNPADPSAWSMCAVVPPSGDYRVVQSHGPFTLAPGGIMEFKTMVMHHPHIPHPCPDIQATVRPRIDSIRTWRANGALDTPAKLPLFVTLPPGQSVLLDAGVPDALAYQWSTGEQGSTISVSVPGTYQVTVTRTTGCPFVASTVVRMGMASTGPAPATSSLHLVPNPAQGRVRVIFDNAGAVGQQYILLRHTDGRLLQTHRVAGSVLDLDVSTLPGGVYWVEWRGEQAQRCVKKLILL
jgi:hypothetical protein